MRSNTLAQHLPMDMASPSAESLARPKVMRRPAHFSTTTSTHAERAALPPVSAPKSQLTDELLSKDLMLPALPAIHQTRSWQDDARFGVAMLMIVFTVNIVLILWLPLLKPISNPVLLQLSTPAASQTQTAADTMTIYRNRPSEAGGGEAPIVHILGGEAEVSQ